MIAFDFVYCRPDTLEEAAGTWTRLREAGRTALYYGGGSEILSMCRAGSIRPDAVIDIKAIPECRGFAVDGASLRIGAACTLNEIGQSGLFPLLRLAGGRIADHTNQCRITLGGNLCGTIIYRETSLPLLLCDARVTCFGPQVRRTVPLMEAFATGRMELLPGELLVDVTVPDWALTARHAHIKKTTNDKIDYPLADVTALVRDGRLRTAYAGVLDHPFRSQAMDDALNDRSLPRAERVRRAVERLPGPPLTDGEGSGPYRVFLLTNTLRELLEAWEHDQL